LTQFSTPEPICPFFGRVDDRETPAGFDSPHNRCFRFGDGLPVPNAHQKRYCLTQGHLTCPAFLQRISATQFAPGIIFPPEPKPISTRNKLMGVIFALITLIIIATLVFLIWRAVTLKIITF
jgi:hypothetical protein